MVGRFAEGCLGGLFAGLTLFLLGWAFVYPLVMTVFYLAKDVLWPWILATWSTDPWLILTLSAVIALAIVSGVINAWINR